MLSYSFCVDKRLRITSWSSDAEKVFGKAVHEVKGSYYYNIMPRIKEGPADALAKTMASGQSLLIPEYRDSCFYGQSKAHIQISPLLDNGKTSGAGVVITQREAVCQIWERMQETQRLVDMGKVAATLAHGVRSPLNAIKGGVVYIKDKLGEKEYVEFINIIEDEISRLDNFIAKFLSTFIGEEGLLRIDMNSIVERIEKLILPQTKSHKIKTLFEYGHTFPVTINPFQLEQAILNVINNAIEAMPSGGILKVRTGSQTIADKEFTYLEVNDTGKGLIEGKVEPSPAIRRGKGLGLLITREIIRSCGGNFEIRTEKVAGTTVALYLPKGARDE